MHPDHIFLYKIFNTIAENFYPRIKIFGRTIFFLTVPLLLELVPLLHLISVDHPFQIVGIDIMEPPVTANGNHYVIMFQNFFIKWPMVFSAPDRKLNV